MSKTILNLTAGQYDQAIIKCKDIFLKKMQDYGTAWRILRPSSLTDQIFIKAQRIRSIEDKKEQRIGDGVESEFIGIINYAAIALVQLQLPANAPVEMEQQNALQRIEKEFQTAKSLMMDKNHDYGEAWRDMRISSMTDLILMKLLRIKQIEDNKGETIISEGVEANYYDIINYAVFALIKLDEDKINS
jgi:Nucleotide modification associated domain 1